MMAVREIISDLFALPASRPWRYFAPVRPVHEAMSRHLIVQAADSAVRATGRGGQALVIGAGRCRDIPLRELLERFEQVTATDIDADALKRGLAEAQLDAGQRQRVSVRIGDVVNIGAAVDRCVDDAAGQPAWSSASREHKLEHLARQVEALTPTPLPPTRQYELVVASCVISQLHLGAIDRAERLLAHHFEPGKLSDQPRWRKAVCTLAARMQQAFAAMLGERVAAGGRLYFAATPRVHLVLPGPNGQWKSRDTHTMLARAEARDFFDAAWQAEAQAQWQWAQTKPRDAHKPMDLFDVEAFIFRSAHPASAPARLATATAM